MVYCGCALTMRSALGWRNHYGHCSALEAESLTQVRKGVLLLRDIAASCSRRKANSGSCEWLFMLYLPRQRFFGAAQKPECPASVLFWAALAGKMSPAACLLRCLPQQLHASCCYICFTVGRFFAWPGSCAVAAKPICRSAAE
jgi:hypothetical protein